MMIQTSYTVFRSFVVDTEPNLFYSREETKLIQERFKFEYTLGAICLRLTHLHQRIKEDQIGLMQQGTIPIRKRPPLQREAGEEIHAKRERIAQQAVEFAKNLNTRGGHHISILFSRC